MNLFKAPNSRNRYSGRVSLSYSEFDDLSPGDKLVINFDDELTIVKTIERWMISDAQDMLDYVLLPYANKYRPY